LKDYANIDKFKFIKIQISFMKINFLLDFADRNDNGITTAALRFTEKLRSEGLKVSINGKGYNYDIIHTHTPSPINIIKMRRAKKLGLKIITHAHTTAEDIKGSFIFTQNNLILNFLDKYLKYFYSHADLVLTPSNWTKNTLISKGLKVPIKILSNGINLKEFKFDKKKAEEFRKKYNIHKDDIIVYSVGIVFIRKGIETFKKVAEKLSDLVFLWIGIGYKPLFVNYRPMKRVLKNIPPNLNFLGYIENKDFVGAHCAGDIFLFPSYVENQAIATLEAAACSKAMVLRNLPTYDWAVHEENCFIAKNDEEFIRNVDFLSKNKNLRYKIGKAAKKVAKKNDINNSIKKLIKIYENLINS